MFVDSVVNVSETQQMRVTSRSPLANASHPVTLAVGTRSARGTVSDTQHSQPSLACALANILDLRGDSS